MNWRGCGKEVVVDHFEVLSWCLSGTTEEKWKKKSSGLTYFGFELGTFRIRSTDADCLTPTVGGCRTYWQEFVLNCTVLCSVLPYVWGRRQESRYSSVTFPGSRSHYMSLFEIFLVPLFATASVF